MTASTIPSGSVRRRARRGRSLARAVDVILSTGMRPVRVLVGSALVAGSLCAAILAAPGSAGASPTSLTLYVNSSGAKANGCSGPGSTACRTILEGIEAAELHTGDAVTVTVAPGTYSAAGEFQITAQYLVSLAIHGAGASATKVTGAASTRDFLVSSGNITISGLSIDNGAATAGGGVHNLNATLTLAGDTFSGDSSPTGGGVYNYLGTLTLADDTFSDDRATYGGGVFNDSRATMIDDTFSDDTADYGGGVANHGTAALTSDTLLDDSATSGGGIYNETTATATLDGTTFLGDAAPFGGGIANRGTASIAASILDGSSCTGALSGLYDVVTTTSFFCTSLGTYVTPSALDLATSLGPNTSTGPETLAIGPSSVAINEVPNAACTDATDERGEPRPGDTTPTGRQTSCDAGAYELQHHIVALAQGPPKAGAAPYGGASFQLHVTNTAALTGKVTYTNTSTTPSTITVASTGRITVSDSTPVGSFMLSGTDTDRLDDDGTWSFELTVGETRTTVLYVRTGSHGTTCTTTALGTAADDACGSIQTAVTAAELSGGTVVITVGSGTYIGRVSITAENSIVIEGAGASKTIVTGGRSEGDFTVTQGDVTISDLSIDDGHDSQGGGVDNDATITLTNDTLSGDTAATTGGGVFNAGTATLTEDTFSGDKAGTYGSGGGVMNTGKAALMDDTFSDDTARSGGGVTDSGSASLTGDTFTNDIANLRGGGLGLTSEGGAATVTGDSFSYDSATLGGGVYNLASTTLSDDTFSGDTAKSTGGGVMNVHVATLSDDTFSGDTAKSTGGGVFNAGTATVADDTFSGDMATYGGGVDNYVTAILADDTFSGDVAPYGGGIATRPIGGTFHSTTTISDSIIGGSSCYSTGATLSGAYNVVTTSSCSSLGTQVAASALDLATSLEPNTSTGPQTLAITPTSVAVNEVPEAACSIASDERGDPRPGDATGTGHQTSCDAGAYELQHRIVTLVQGQPETGTVAYGKAERFQLTVTNGTGTPSFAATPGSLPLGVTESKAGTITVPDTTAAGVYTVDGTDSDTLHDSGAWSFTLTVGQAPAITSSDVATFTVGKAGSFQVTTTGTPLPTVSETGGLPSGVTLSPTGLLSGTPAAGTDGSYPITLAATNGVEPKASQSFTLHVTGQAPAITSPTTAFFTIGKPGSFTVTTSGTPTASVNESGKLPTGLSFKTEGDGEALISGSALKRGTHVVTVTATNGITPEATQILTIVVGSAPVFRTRASATFVVGQQGSHLIRTRGIPSATLSATGTLPPGLSFKTTGIGTATITGTPGPATGGSYHLTITAANGVGTSTQNFTLIVDEPPAFLSGSSTTFVPKTANAFIVQTSGYPASSVKESGALPKGVRFKRQGKGTAIISGTPTTTKATVYNLEFTATNGVGSAVIQTFTLTVS